MLPLVAFASSFSMTTGCVKDPIKPKIMTSKILTSLILVSNSKTKVFIFLIFFAISGKSQITTYSSLNGFEQSIDCSFQLENFDGYLSGVQVSQLFNGIATFDQPLPTIFFGGWNAYGTQGDFFQGSLIPEPRFQGQPLIINFPTPVNAIGANVFDDFDGTPFINIITLTITSTTGAVASISENFPNVGDAGFLGGASVDGIVKAEFSINNTNGNFEIDLLRLCDCLDNDNDNICDSVDTDDDNDGCLDDNDPYPTLMGEDSDCDGISDDCDICLGGDDSIDENGDGIPDCSQLLNYEEYNSDWYCANNKINICHNNGNTLCINKNAISAHLNNGYFVGPCLNCNATENFDGSDESHQYIEDHQLKLNLYPNPANNDLYVSFDGITDDSKAMIYNSVGDIVLIKQLGKGQHHLKIDVSTTQFPNGMYTINIITVNDSIVRKFIVSK